MCSEEWKGIPSLQTPQSGQKLQSGAGNSAAQISKTNHLFQEADFATRSPQNV
jgi:hypothetical protein